MGGRGADRPARHRKVGEGSAQGAGFWDRRLDRNAVARGTEMARLLCLLRRCWRAPRLRLAWRPLCRWNHLNPIQWLHRQLRRSRPRRRVMVRWRQPHWLLGCCESGRRQVRSAREGVG